MIQSLKWFLTVNTCLININHINHIKLHESRPRSLMMLYTVG